MEPLELIEPSEMDRLLKYPKGRSLRLARRGKLPHIELPDGEIRFEWDAISIVLQEGRRVSHA